MQCADTLEMRRHGLSEASKTRASSLKKRWPIWNCVAIALLTTALKFGVSNRLKCEGSNPHGPSYSFGWTFNMKYRDEMNLWEVLQDKRANVSPGGDKYWYYITERSLEQLQISKYLLFLDRSVR